MQGQFWEDDGQAELALAHLVRFMPVRDSLLLFSSGGDDRFFDFLLEHVRLALLVRAKGPIWARGNATHGVTVSHLFATLLACVCIILRPLIYRICHYSIASR